MGRPLKIKKTTTKDIGFNSWNELTNPVFPETFNDTQFAGVVGGGNTSIATSTYPVVKCQVFGANEGSEEEGYIIRQKGSTKYLVEGQTSGNVFVCALANETTGNLTAGNMNLTFSNDDSSETLIARLTNKFALDYSNNRYLVNFFTDEGSGIKSGTTGSTLNYVIVENYTS